MMTEFKEFAMKGNVVEMAVGIIIGAALGKIIASLVQGHHCTANRTDAWWCQLQRPRSGAKKPTVKLHPCRSTTAR